MARISFQLKGSQLFALVFLWVALSAVLFVQGTRFGHRADEPETADARGWMRAEGSMGSAEQATPPLALPPATVAPPPEETLDVIYQRRVQAPATPFGNEILEAASLERVNPALVAAIVWIESEFDPRAVSDKGAVGLMQVMPRTAERFGYEASRLTDPAANLAAGSRYLRWLDQRYAGNLALILGGYNAGEGAVDRYGGMPPYPETRRYVQRVLAAFRSLDPNPYATARRN